MRMPRSSAWQRTARRPAVSTPSPIAVKTSSSTPVLTAAVRWYATKRSRMASSDMLGEYRSPAEPARQPRMGRPPEVTCATPAPAKGRDTTAQGVDAEERLRHLPRVEPAALDRALDALHRLYRGVERL